MRFERKFTADTRRDRSRPKGILTARLQQDPLLTGFTTIVLDEFHERSIHADLGLALARQAWRARDDLRIVVMSATLDASRWRRFSTAARRSRCPAGCIRSRSIISPGESVAAAAATLLRQTSGQRALLPARRAGDQSRAAGRARSSVGPDVDVVPLHGSLPADEQDRAICRPGGGRA